MQHSYGKLWAMKKDRDRNRETKNMENWTSKRERLIVSMHSSIMTAHSPAFGNSCNPRCKSQHCAVTVSLVLVDDTDFKSYLSLSRYDVCVAKFILPKLLNWLKFHHQPTKHTTQNTNCSIEKRAYMFRYAIIQDIYPYNFRSIFVIISTEYRYRKLTLHMIRCESLNASWNETEVSMQFCWHKAFEKHWKNYKMHEPDRC